MSSTDQPPHRVALVTGGSSGIGEAAVRLLARNGFTVWAAARRLELMQPLTEHGIRVVELDVTDDDSTRACVGRVLEESGRIDVLVNNAGYGSYGAVEDVPLEEARRQFEVNVFGLARITQLVLPGMREQRSGTVVNISSMGGRIYTSFGGWYHAAKHALEGLSDAMRLELAPFGVDVVVIEPGGIRTDWGAIAADHLEQVSGTGAYAGAAQRSARGMRRRYAGTSLSSPDVIAKAVLAAATASRPRTRYVVGAGARPLITLRTLLPDRAFDALIRRVT